MDAIGIVRRSPHLKCVPDGIDGTLELWVDLDLYWMGAFRLGILFWHARA